MFSIASKSSARCLLPHTWKSLPSQQPSKKSKTTFPYTGVLHVLKPMTSYDFVEMRGLPQICDTTWYYHPCGVPLRILPLAIGEPESFGTQGAAHAAHIKESPSWTCLETFPLSLIGWFLLGWECKAKMLQMSCIPLLPPNARVLLWKKPPCGPPCRFAIQSHPENEAEAFSTADLLDSLIWERK